jgi:HEAT repeat protein
MVRPSHTTTRETIMADTLHKIEPLIAALGDVDATVRRNAAWALGQLADAEAQARRNAAWALGQLADAEAQARRKAAEALGTLSDWQRLGQLVAFVRHVVTEALATLRRPS